MKLWENGTPGYDKTIGQPEPNLTYYPVESEKPLGCVIVCPGGGYAGLAPHEGEPIAKMLNDHGIPAFVLTYRVAPYHYPEITGDALRAIRYVRHNATKFNIDPEHIGILGFSAGGHLALSSAIVYDDGRDDGDEIDRVSSRPDMCILCYAVSSLIEPYTHGGTKANLLRDVPNADELAKELTGYLTIRDDAPYFFIWHTADDGVVPSEEAILLALELKKKNKPFDLHIYPWGPHGLGLASQMPDVSTWCELLCTRLKLNGWA